jgi:multiple sugar transport system permease protein/N,N'-diacetylchitobiose transport system permease protein
MSHKVDINKRRSRIRSREQWFAYALLVPSALVIFGVVLYPIIRTLIISLYNITSALAINVKFVGLDNYVSVLSDSGFWASVGRTAYFTLVSTPVELILGMALAMLLNVPLRWRWVFRAIVVVPWALPTIVNAALWRNVFNAQYGPLNAALSQVGLIHSYHAWLNSPFEALNMVMVADIWKNTSIVSFFLLAGLQTIPRDVYESARVDGARAVRRFLSITLPLIIPSIAIVLVLRTVEAFKVFDIIYGMTRGGPADGTQTVTYYTYVTAFSNEELSIGSAIAYLILICILILTTIYLRFLRRSEMSVI